MQLIVLGMHRSGTSVLARLLNLMGAYFGPEGVNTGANQENPKGFWERKDVRQLNDSVLHAVGCDWNRVLSLNLAALPKSVVDDFNRRASRLVLEMDGHRPWLLKEPRLCLLLPLWLRFMEVPVGIHIYRHPVEVASSLHKRNRIPLLAGLDLWERYVRSALEASAGMPRIVVSHRQLMEAPAAAVSRLLLDLEREGVAGLRTPTPREIEAFVRQDLYRERETREELRAFANVTQLSLFRTLDAGRLPNAGHKPGDMAALAEYEAALPPLQLPLNENKVTETTEGALRAQLALREQEIKVVRELSNRYEADLKQRDVWLQRMEESQRQRDERIKVLEAAHEQDRHAITQLTADLKQCGEQVAAFEGEAAGLRVQLKAKDTAMGELRDMLRGREHENRLLVNAKLKVERTLETRYQEITKLSQLVLARDEELARAATDLEAAARRLENQRRVSAQIENELLGIKRSRSWRVLNRIQGVSGRLGLSRKSTALLSHDAALVRQSDAFDAAWYLKQYPDVADSGMDPVEHYLCFGAAELRDPGPNFDTAGYLKRNPDVSDSGLNPLLHYLTHGKTEGRSPK